eukprot:1392372-Amorphochlora_amoeboformis.AAC.1
MRRQCPGVPGIARDWAPISRRHPTPCATDNPAECCDKLACAVHVSVKIVGCTCGMLGNRTYVGNRCVSQKGNIL